MTKYLIPILIFSFQIIGYSQLSTNSNVSPNNLVQNNLLGSGVNAYNISYTGSSNAIGSFNGSNCNIGLASGIIMTTGTVRNQTSLFGAQEGPFGPNDEAGSGIDNNEPGDGQLAGLANGNSTHNAAILEFDFDATGSVVSFNYVFASDEYPEFVNAGYNDVFAFWISGPGISGNQNIAIIPGSSTPVTIDNVNSGANSSYYVNNGDGNSSPQNNNNAVVQYDGFTTVLNASTEVQCGQTYHIKIAICDVGDGTYDSGVFLEGGSFTSPAPMLVSSQTNTLGNLNNNELLEGCSDATITFTRSDSVAFNQTFQLSYSGSATNGTDYTNLPNTVTFPAGQTTTTINLQTIADILPENMENLTITILYSGLCGQQTTLSTTLQIIDQPILNLTMPPNQELSCLTGNSIPLTPVITGGTPNYIYNWNTGEQTSEIIASPTDTTTYILTVTDACGIQSVIDSVRLTVAIFEPLVVTTSNDTTVYCPNSPIDISATSTGGAGNISYSWNNNAGNNAQTTVQTLVDNIFIVTATDGCGNQDTDSLIVDIIRDTLSTETYGDTLICPFGDAVIGVNANSGTGDYRYEWDNTETNNEIMVSPPNTQYFYVNVYDSCNTYFIRDSVLVSTIKPTANFFTNPTEGIENLPIYFGNQSQNAVEYYWDFDNGEFSVETNPTNTYVNEGEYLVTLIAMNYLGCTDTISKYFTVHPEYFGYVPNAFTPNNDGNNDYFKGSFVGVKELELFIFNRWGELIYQSNSLRARWDGTEKGKEAPIDAYIYKYKLKDYSNITHEYTGHITLIR